MFITHETDPATVEGIARVDSERKAAQDALKMTSLSNAKIYLGGVAATYKDMSDGAKYDLMIAVVSALTLIFIIMLILTRARWRHSSSSARRPARSPRPSASRCCSGRTSSAFRCSGWSC